MKRSSIGVQCIYSESIAAHRQVGDPYPAPEVGVPRQRLPTRFVAVHRHVSGVVAALPLVGPALAPLVAIPSRFGTGGVAVRPEVAGVVDALALLDPGCTLLVSVGGVATRGSDDRDDDDEET